MTPFLKSVKKRVEKLFGKWDEGPTPPKRLEQLVAVWAKTKPTATRAEWAAFATEHAARAYLEGYVRGAEGAERGYDHLPEESPDVAAERAREAWEFDPSQVPGLDDGPVLDTEKESPTDEGAAARHAYAAWMRSRAAMGPSPK